MAIERALDAVALSLGKDPLDVRLANLYGVAGDLTPYGQTVTDSVSQPIMEDLAAACDYRARRAAIARANARSPHLARGIALTPVKFGISFTTTHLNQAGALVHVYTDGSILLVANAINYDATDERVDDAWSDAVRRLDAMQSDLATHSAASAVTYDTAAAGEVASRTPAEEYMAGVERCKEYIRAGDAFQIVLSQRFSTPCTASAFDVYRILRATNPSPYMYLIRVPEDDRGRPDEVAGALGGGALEFGTFHLRCDGALPDEFVKPMLVGVAAQRGPVAAAHQGRDIPLAIGLGHQVASLGPAAVLARQGQRRRHARAVGAGQIAREDSDQQGFRRRRRGNGG